MFPTLNWTIKRSPDGSVTWTAFGAPYSGTVEEVYARCDQLASDASDGARFEPHARWDVQRLVGSAAVHVEYFDGTIDEVNQHMADLRDVTGNEYAASGLTDVAP